MQSIKKVAVHFSNFSTVSHMVLYSVKAIFDTI